MLKDRKITELASKDEFWFSGAGFSPEFLWLDFARAIEAEVLKEQSAKLSELERQLVEVRKDAERFRFDGEKQYHMPGMSLRDYFAAKAMQSYLLDKDRDSFTFEQWANAAYEMADAMIKTRKQGENHDHT